MFESNDDDDGFKLQILFSSFALAIVWFVWKSTQVRELNFRGIGPLSTNSINLSYGKKKS